MQKNETIQATLTYLFYHIPNIVVSNVERPPRSLYANYDSLILPNLIIIKNDEVYTF